MSPKKKKSLSRLKSSTKNPQALQILNVDPLGACIFLFTEKMKYFIKDRNNPEMPANCMCSYGESKVNKILSRAGALERWVVHNQKHIRYFLAHFDIL